MASPSLVNNTQTNVNSAPITDVSSGIGAGIGALTGLIGNSQATNALVGGEQNAIGTQQGVQNQLQGIYGVQRGLGNASDVGLASQLGLYGTPDYSAFNNSPGFQFAVGQGNQAINRQAAASGSLYTPNTLANLSQLNTGYASQNYNNYINQLLQSAGLGAQGNAGLASGITSTGNNISQLQQNQGNAKAGGAANASGIASNLLSRLPYGQIGSAISGLGNSNNSGVVNGGSSLFGGGVNGNSSYNDYNSTTGSGTFNNNSLFGQYSNSSGYDPTTGNYNSVNPLGSGGFNQFSSQSGYDPTTGNFSTPDNFNISDPSSGSDSSF